MKKLELLKKKEGLWKPFLFCGKNDEMNKMTIYGCFLHISVNG